MSVSSTANDQELPSQSDDDRLPPLVSAQSNSEESDGEDAHESNDPDAEYNPLEDDEDEDEDDFHDAEEHGFTFEVFLGEGAADGDEAQEDGGPLIQQAINPQGIRILQDLNPARSLRSILRQAGLRAFVDDDDGDDRVDRLSAPDPNRFPKVPSEEGRELMDSGMFGAFDIREPDSTRKMLARRILNRELGVAHGAARHTLQRAIAQDMVPSTNSEMIVNYVQPVCCGQFSDDGTFFYACVKDYKVRMYDTSNPYNWRYYKTASYPGGAWTLTDAHLSPDNRWLAFTSLKSEVCFAPTDPNDTGDPYSLDMDEGSPSWGNRRGGFPIFSVRFSGDGRTLVAGTGARTIVVYDIEQRRALHTVTGHGDDVNAVCFADKSSPHILYSGSDDCTIKVWDTRSIRDGREAGAFVGHIEGLTYIDSKGDGRYILSNAKDQSMKLWDLRMARSSTNHLQHAHIDRRPNWHGYDYRWEEYDDSRWYRMPQDNSLVTFRGHKVQRTLIRCHFSPPGSSDSRYVYSGSQDGYVYVWNLDATLKAKINVRAATMPPNLPVWSHQPLPRQITRIGHRDYEPDWLTLVRDVGWHPNTPLVVASSWQGPELQRGTLSLHSFNDNESDEGEPAMGRKVDEKLNEDLHNMLGFL